MNKIQSQYKWNNLRKLLLMLISVLFIICLPYFINDNIKKKEDTHYLLNLVMHMVSKRAQV